MFNNNNNYHNKNINNYKKIDYNYFNSNINTNTNTNTNSNTNSNININTNTITGSWNNNEQKKTYSKFRNSFSYIDRIGESSRILTKYPDRIPVICEKGNGRDNPDIDKNKYLVPNDLTIGNFLLVIRKRIKLESHEALFLMTNGSIPPTTAIFKDLYHRYKDSDGYLYMTYTKENTFG